MREPQSVAGRMEMTHADFQRACQIAIGDFQQEPQCQSYLVALFCEAVRCSRECCEIATIRPDAAELSQLRAKCERLEWDIEAYRGALGYSIKGSHTGKLTDGTTPQCGMCNSEYRRGMESRLEEARRLLEEVGCLKDERDGYQYSIAWMEEGWLQRRDQWLSQK